MANPTEPQTPLEPEPVEPVAASEHLGVEPVVPEVDEAEVVDDVAEPVVVEPVAPAAVPLADPSPREVVYVQAPTPPAPRGNRGFGVLISIIGAIAFALLYLGAASIIIAFTPGANVEASIGKFLVSGAFWAPVAAYAVFAVLFALIVNRAAWWAHVIGSLFVAALTYAASIAALALASNIFAMTPDQAVDFFGIVAVSPFLLSALALAREASLWFGLAIASRGRRVKERNATERALFEQSVAERRAEYERAHPHP
ncbi:hypothetical protein [Protaetiibacter intestinalis]|uniref:Uncharacterized protein n=1 Tax=Protaetiibacter intestinalis TaxID=2419774 RepID=A0A387B917_9MICO|nr:hypothetical protein [Protaetiibacter intestinalis]AYF97586.1 hypothetical protein D7I47_04455 [Protaetiibacter intestinalis]